MDDLISRQQAIDAVRTVIGDNRSISICEAIEQLPSALGTNLAEVGTDCISRQAAIDFIDAGHLVNPNEPRWSDNEVVNFLKSRPSAHPEQRYTEEELRVFKHGISLSLLSKRSAQRWRYDKDTATEIEFLERLYDKVSADMKGGQG